MDDGVWYEIDSPSTILVLEEVLGMPDCKNRQEEQWEEILSVDVLEYLIEKEYIEVNVQMILTMLDRAAIRGLQDMAEHLLDLLDEQQGYDELPFIEQEEINDEVEGSMWLAAESGHVSIVKLLRDYIPVTDDEQLLEACIIGEDSETIEYALKWSSVDQAVQVAIRMGSEKSLSLLLERGKFGLKPTEMASLAICNDSLEVLEVLLKWYPDLEEKVDWNSVLEQAIRESNNLETVQYILEHGVDIKIDSALLTKAASEDSDIFEVLMSDTRARPTDIYSILNHAVSKDRTALIILDCPRVRIERLTSREVRMLVPAVWSRSRDKIDGYYLAARLVSGSGLVKDDNQRLDDQIERKDIYSLVLRFILFRSPTASELVDWMIELGDRSIALRDEIDLIPQSWQQLATAAESVMGHRQVEDHLLPLRALMLSMLHPTLSVQELICDLRLEGARSDSLLRSIRLVCTYLGRREIEQRASREREKKSRA
ncbi:Hypothetical protein POVR2_LOCUS335 [uncultured virus]|nr:Hypothetical protein POVR2_LOCUS335 [uncultured virus]